LQEPLPPSATALIELYVFGRANDEMSNKTLGTLIGARLNKPAYSDRAVTQAKADMKGYVKRRGWPKPT
jgi:hypothetical protein